MPDSEMLSMGNKVKLLSFFSVKTLTMLPIHICRNEYLSFKPVNTKVVSNLIEKKYEEEEENESKNS